MIKNFAKTRLSFFTKKEHTTKFVSLSSDFYIYASFILAIALSSSVWSAIALYNSQKAALQDQLITQSQLIDTELSNYLNYVSHIAEDKGHKIALKEGNLDQVAYMFKRNFFFPVTKSGLKRKAFIWPHFSWVDKKGNILVKSEVGILSKPEKIKDAEHLYQSAINTWQLHLSDPYLDAFEDQTFIDASLGVSDLKNDKYIGSITTRFNIEKLVEAIKTGLKPDTKFIILDEGLKIVIQSDDNLINNDDFFATKLANNDPEADLITMQDKLKYHGNTYRIYKKSSDYPFIILTGYNSNSFNKEFTITLIERFVALFGAAFVIAIILFFQRQKIIKPVNHLAAITKKLSAGEDVSDAIKCIKTNNRKKYSSEIYELYQGILLTKDLIDKEKENNLKLIELNNKLEHQNELAKKSKQSREKFLSETRQNIIEDTIIKITKDIATILDCEEGNVAITKQTSIDLHKKVLSSCAKILSYVSDSLNLSDVNVKKIITEAVEMANHDASINNVELITNIADNIANIYVDERSIKHVITALINYAMDDRKRGKNSFVKITARIKQDVGKQDEPAQDNTEQQNKEKESLQIIFEDNGHGISEEMRMNFQQTAQKEGKNENNTSLSLHSIRSILSSHNSILQIDNVMGKGSVITIEIPYGTTNEEVAEAAGEPNEIDNVIALFPRK